MARLPQLNTLLMIKFVSQLCFIFGKIYIFYRILVQSEQLLITMKSIFQSNKKQKTFMLVVNMRHL